MITTLIPSYRRPQLLERAIRSVQRQTVQDLQIIVFDNASGDETAAVVARLAAGDPRVHYRVHDHNIGGPANFQFAFSHAETEYVSLLCDDDLLMPHVYEQALAAFAVYPTAGFVASPVMIVNDAGRVLGVTGRDWPPGVYPPPGAMLRMAEKDHFILTGALFRRAAIEVRATDVEAGLSSDVNLMLRIAGRFPVVVVPRAGAVFSLHRDSPSSFPRFENYWPTWRRIITNLGSDESIPASARQAAVRGLRGRLAASLLVVGIFSISRGYDDEAKAAAAVLQRESRRATHALLLRSVVVACRFPIIRRLLSAMVRWSRGRQRGNCSREQDELDRYRGLLVVPGAPLSEEAAA